MADARVFSALCNLRAAAQALPVAAAGDTPSPPPPWLLRQCGCLVGRLASGQATPQRSGGICRFVVVRELQGRPRARGRGWDLEPRDAERDGDGDTPRAERPGAAHVRPREGGAAGKAHPRLLKIARRAAVGISEAEEREYRGRERKGAPHVRSISIASEKSYNVI